MSGSTITSLEALDVRFPTSRTLAGSDAMNGTIERHQGKSIGITVALNGGCTGLDQDVLIEIGAYGLVHFQR